MISLIEWLRVGRAARYIVVGVIAFTIAGTGIVIAGGLIPAPDGTIWGCYVAATGALRLVSGPTECRPTEVPIRWNQAGPTGATGATGPIGATGTTGAQGPQGPVGITFLSTWNSSTAYVVDDVVTANGETWIAITVRSTPGVSGPRSTRSPTNTARRPG